MSEDKHQDNLQQVMQDTHLVRNILKYCQYCDDMVDPATMIPGIIQTMIPDRFKHLKKTTLVNRLFHEVSSELMYAEMTIAKYSKLHPEMAPDDHMRKSFEFYQNCVRTIYFDSVSCLSQYLPFLISQGNSLHYLIYRHEYHRAEHAETIAVADLRKRVIRLKNMAVLDKQGRVFMHHDLGQAGFGSILNKWPNGFKIIRELNVDPKPVSMDYLGVDPHVAASIQESQYLKTCSLDTILQHHTTPDESNRNDEEYICSMAVSDTENMRLVLRLLSYPFLQSLSIISSEMTTEDFMTILETANLKSLNIGSENINYGEYPTHGPYQWTAPRLCAFIRAYADSPNSVKRLYLSIQMSPESIKELRMMASTSNTEERLGAIVLGDRRQALISFEDTRDSISEDDTQEEVLEHGAEMWQAIFPQWSWMSHHHRPEIRGESEQLFLFICCSDVEYNAPGLGGPDYTFMGGFIGAFGTFGGAFDNLPPNVAPPA